MSVGMLPSVKDPSKWLHFRQFPLYTIHSIPKASLIDLDWSNHEWGLEPPRRSLPPHSSIGLHVK